MTDTIFELQHSLEGRNPGENSDVLNMLSIVLKIKSGIIDVSIELRSSQFAHDRKEQRPEPFAVF